MADRHRGDIDGLRALAVVFVVAFHAGLPGFSGGFVGVDVFFVISGFLITGLLLREFDETGGIALSRFWARRLRRLAPALTVVVIASLVGAFLVYSPLRWAAIAREALASSLYFSNIDFALQSRGYFTAAAGSPLLHTWSLAVEEQFYVLWPLAITLVVLAARRLQRQRDTLLALLVVIAVAASFGLSFLLTQRGTPWAYYSLPTRWWEIGIGALCALWVRRWRLPGNGAVVLSIIGPVLLVVALLTISPITPFPGAAALLPMAGTACLIVAFDSQTNLVGRLLALPALQWLGRVSYSWYLWHWPVLILAGTVGVADSVPRRVMWALLSLIPATATHYLVERPIRFSKRLSLSTRWSAAAGVACITIGLLGAGTLWSAARHEMTDPFLKQLQRVRDLRQADYTSETKSSGPLVMLVGDSHAAHWAPGVKAAAERLGFRLLIRTRGGCPPWRVEVAKAGTAQPSSACQEFRRNTDDEIGRLHPVAVVVSSGNYAGRILASNGGLLARNEEGQAWSEGVGSYLRWLKNQKTAIGLILDNPYVPFDPIECLGLHRTPAACTFDRSEGLAGVGPIRDVESAAALRVGIGEVFDPLPLICDGDRCSVWANDMPAYSDRTHLVPDFVVQQRDSLAPFLSGLVQASGNSVTGSVKELSAGRQVL